MYNPDIRKTVCSICLANCGIDAHIKDGKLVKVEGSKECRNKGKLCVKAYAMKDYIYREDRIKTPLRRIGKRGEGQFEPISWDEAYKEIAEKLGGYKAEYGADSVAFYTGYSKWYRTIFHRFVYSFGTMNYGTESSACFQAVRLADMLNAGSLSRPDIANTDVFLAWAYNPFYNGVYDHEMIEDLQEKGLKVVCIDPRVTPFAQLSDIHLKIKAGTDGALALFFGNYLIEKDSIDHEYIENYVHGFEEYKAYVKAFTVEKTSAITGIPEKQLLEAAQLLADSEKIAIHEGSAPLTHHRNGVQNFRAVMALSAIKGSYDHVGGNLPTEFSKEKLNYPKMIDDEFIEEVRPKNAKPKIGTERFPVWSEYIEEFQAMDLSRQILEGTPYPLKALFTLGLNVRMFPGNDQLFEALEKIDFFVNTDLFMTDTCKYADIVLPACSSFERSQFQSAFLGGAMAQPVIRYVEPVIEPLYESKSDVDILTELADYLELDDPVLRKGYEYCCTYLLQKVGVTFQDLKSSHAPTPIPGKIPYVPMTNAKNGYKTPTGKFEIYSEALKSYGYEPLPVYQISEDEADPAEYPLLLTAGGRLPYEFHSRFQNTKWTKYFRKYPMADINPKDAKKLGIRQEQDITVATATGEIYVKANLTHMVQEGSVFMYQDYSTADVNAIIGVDHLDPISGFPGYRSVRCRLLKSGKKNSPKTDRKEVTA